jgi:uncharacterized protein YjbI with pentapeptide repeats
MTATDPITLAAGSDHEAETFTGLSVISTDLSNARLIDCRFENCAFSSVKLDQAALQCDFAASKIEGINFFTAKRSMLRLSFDGCLIRHSSFAELKLAGIHITNCTLQNVDFADADLSKADFSNSTFEDCTFKNTNLTKADFRGARGYTIDPTLNRLRGAKFSIPEVLALLSGFGIEVE